MAAPILVPLGVPEPIKSLPVASFRKLPRLKEPSAFRTTEGVRLTKSALLAASPLPFTLALLFHQTFVLETSVPLVLSLDVPAKLRLFVNTWVPESKAKLLCPLLHEVLLVNCMEPGLLL
ncbi:hypothetical protein D3C73_1443500 [compost metagenome]